MMPIAMNLSSERKQSMKSLLTVISLALAVASPAFAGMDWNFPVDNQSGGATITLGALGTGWHDGNTSPWNLGSSGLPASGFWDLGASGSITLSLAVDGVHSLHVFQWVAPGVYDGTLSYTVTQGGNQVASGFLGAIAQITTPSPSGAPGAWWEYGVYLGSLVPGETIEVQAGAGGAIIDRLTLVPEPATLIAGAVLLIPFAFSTWPILRRRAK